MHEWDSEYLSDEQQDLAREANTLREQIQFRMHRVFGCGVAPTPELITRHLGFLHDQLATVEARLWAASSPQVSAIHAATANVVTLLAQPPKADGLRSTVNAILGNARVVETGLLTLTSLQSQTMLSMPPVAAVLNIAFDARDEFDNATAYERWRDRMPTVIDVPL